MVPNEYYQLLGVSRYASKDAIRRAFRSTVLSTHPDRNPGDTLATERTRRVIEAYKALTGASETSIRELPPVSPAPRVAGEQRSFREACPSPHWLYRLSATLCVVAFTVYVAILVAHTIVAEQTPIFRPYTGEILYPAPTPVVAATVDPDPLDSVAWYSEQEYQLSLANKSATSRMLGIYSSAAKRAAAHGDRRLARFYRSALRDVEDCRSAPFHRQD